LRNRKGIGDKVDMEKNSGMVTARAVGADLDMDGGKDSLDEEFERFK
jgi:hypothetical protein